MVLVEKKANNACIHIYTVLAQHGAMIGACAKNAYPTPKQTLENVAKTKSSHPQQSCGTRKTATPHKERKAQKGRVTQKVKGRV